MRIPNIFYKNRRLSRLVFLCFIVVFTAKAQEPVKDKGNQTINVSIKVVDVDGVSVPNAKVVVGEGVIHAETDQNGSLSFMANPRQFVTITAAAFEKSVSVVSDLLQDNTIKLSKSKLYMTSYDEIPFPFTTIKKRFITGPESMAETSRLERYPSSDIRNSLTGLTSAWDIRELFGSPGINAQEYLGRLGATPKFTGVPMVIVDGIPTSFSEMPIDAAEIESITLNKGILASAMFGPSATNGYFMIKTKRGYKNERKLNVDFEAGVSTIDRMPGWVPGGDYATLNNQARANDMLSQNYPQKAISEYAKNDPYNLYYPSVNFRDLLLKNNKSFRKVDFLASGGNEKVQYFSYLHYNQEGDIYKVGSLSDYTKISTRQNVDVKINEFIKVGLSFYGNLTERRSPNYGYTTNEGGSQLNELPSLLNDTRNIPPVAFPVYANNNPTDNIPRYGVSSIYTDNPVGNLVGQGYYNETGRMAASNVILDIDLNTILKGLKSTTYIGFNIYNMDRLGQAEDYQAYIVTPQPDSNILLTKSSAHSYISTDAMTKLVDHYYQRFAVYENLEFNRTFNKHTIQSNLTYYIYKAFINDQYEPQRGQNALLHSIYSYDDKYAVELALNYAGSYSFPQENRYKLFPSAGASWVISDEGFMSGIGVINFLKLRAQGGIMGVESYLSPFYNLDSWSYNTGGTAFGASGSLQWFGNTTDANVKRTTNAREGNPNLSWPLLKSINAGFDALMFDRKLSLALTYDLSFSDGNIEQVQNILPYSSGLSGGLPYLNFNSSRGQTLYSDIQYTQKVGALEISIGGNFTTSVSKTLKYDEPEYRFSYQFRSDKPSDAIFGFNYLGKFQTNAETLLIPQMFDQQLKTGDLKYEDLNKDGIVDDNDQTMIGHSSPRLYYGIDLSLKYKNFEFFVFGAGRAFYDLPLNNAYYWNGWGDNNYSNFVRDNIGGAYPRLTYNKVNNNFMMSKFWLVKGDYFKIQNIELAYTIQPKYLHFIKSNGIRIYLRGANLLTFSKVKDVDPESINSGVTNYPLYRTFSGGIKFNF